MTFPSNSDSVAQDQLQAFVQRIERLEEEISALNTDKSEVYSEAKGSGFDVKVLRKIIADRRKDYAARMEFETIYDLYAAALGMSRAAAEQQASRVRAREDMDWQPPKVVSLSEQKAAFRAGKPISQDWQFENASVYFFAFGEVGRIKIGVSNDVPRRLANLTNELRCEGVVLHVIAGNRRAEMAAHRAFQQWRLEGEWFEDCPELRAAIAAYISDKKSPDPTVPVSLASEAEQPVREDQSTAAGADPLGTEGKERDSRSPDRTLVGQEEALILPAGDQAEPGAGESLPVDDGEGGAATVADVLPDPVAADPGKSEAASAAAAPAPGKRAWRYEDKAHPDCLNPEQCGGFSNLARCDRCKAAAA